MPRCACGQNTCACSIIALPEDGIEISGVGSQASPYRIKNLRNDPLGRVEVIDTDTVDLTFTPLSPGDPNGPYTLQADATLGLVDLTDVDGADIPVTGDVVTWNGTKWVFSPAAGGGGTPVSDVWGTAPLDKYGANSLIGEPSYVDSNGKLRGRPQVIPSAQCPAIADSPNAYPMGLSIAGINSTDAPVKGWPASGQVVTYVRYGDTVGNVVAQWFYQNHTPQSSPPVVMYRAGNANNNPAWSAWAAVGSTSASSVYAAIRRQAAAVVTVSATPTAIPWDTVEANDGIPFAASVFTIPVAGYYNVQVGVNFAPSATGYRQIRVLVNGVVVTTASPAASQAVTGTPVGMAKTYLLAAGDTVEIRVLQNSGANLNLNASAADNWVSITKVPAQLGVPADTGWVNDPAQVFTANPTNFTIISCGARVKNGVCQILIRGTMKVASSSPGTTGDITDLNLGTVLPQWTPAATMAPGCLYTGHIGRPVNGVITASTGALTIGGIGGSTPLAVNEAIALTGTYIL